MAKMNDNELDMDERRAQALLKKQYPNYVAALGIYGTYESDG